MKNYKNYIKQYLKISQQHKTNENNANDYKTSENEKKKNNTNNTEKIKKEIDDKTIQDITKTKHTSKHSATI